jgi:dTDP-6-deoxy-L-talose 4-dehydrogenase (NAD+)
MAITNANADVVNICSGIPTTVEQIVRTWIRKHSWSIEPDLGRFPYLDYEPLAFWGSADHWHQVELNAQIVLSGHDES